jgi:hypothetical protein
MIVNGHNAEAWSASEVSITLDAHRLEATGGRVFLRKRDLLLMLNMLAAEESAAPDGRCGYCSAPWVPTDETGWTCSACYGT